MGNGCSSRLQALNIRYGKYILDITFSSTKHSNGRDLKIGSSNLHQESLPVNFAGIRNHMIWLLSNLLGSEFPEFRLFIG